MALEPNGYDSGVTSARDIDAAFLLEGVPGVLGVYTIEPRTGEADGYDLAVHVAGTHALAGAHYRLMGARSRAECARVLFYTTELPAALAERARRIVLDANSRDGARDRVQKAAPPPDPDVPLSDAHLRSPRYWQLVNILVVRVDDDVADAIASAFGSRAVMAHSFDSAAGAERALTEAWHLVVCSARAAFGPEGFLTRVEKADPTGASAVVLVARDDAEEARTRLMLAAAKAKNLVITPGFPPEVLRTHVLGDPILRGLLEQRHASEPTPDLLAVGLLRRVLVVDHHPVPPSLLRDALCLGLDVVLARSVPAAIARVADPFDFVVCNAQMRTNGEPLYRLLWRLRPALKGRFVLLVPPDATPPSNDGRPRRVLHRPVTARALRETLERLNRDEA